MFLFPPFLTPFLSTYLYIISVRLTDIYVSLSLCPTSLCLPFFQLLTSSSQSLQWILFQQMCNQVLSIISWCFISVWPFDVTYSKQQKALKENKSPTANSTRHSKRTRFIELTFRALALRRSKTCGDYNFVLDTSP